jgi:hypothetical protein
MTVDPPPARAYTLQHNGKATSIVVAYAASAGNVCLVRATVRNHDATIRVW